ncbi:MAG: RNA-binding protein [Thermoplasmata archaeon]|nr:MAG: RNA-binding protein [Thermoplasmata archaeon]
MDIRKRHPLRMKEARKIIEEIERKLKCNVFYTKSIETAIAEGYQILLIDGEMDIIIVNGNPFLTLQGIKKYKPEKKFVTVDKGAVPFIVKGADVMAPGIVNADDEIIKGEMVWVRNEEGTPLAIGIALIDGKEMIKEKKGKAVKTIHHLGDTLWATSTSL